MTATPSAFAIHEYGDAGLLVDVRNDDAERRWADTQALGKNLRTRHPDGLVDVVASFTSVFISFDPLRTDRATIEATVAELARQQVHDRPRQRFAVPVVYGGTHGPDLAGTADLVGMAPTDLVDWHTSQDWVVRVVGSPNGAPLMDGPRLPDSLPRLAVPRPKVERGSVGLSGFQSIIYNAASPGGWRLIGRSPVVMFALDRPPHVPYSPGDRIRFRSIPPEEWERWTDHRLAPQPDLS